MSDDAPINEAEYALILDRDEIYGLACSGVVAYHFPQLEGIGIVCAEPDCLVDYAALMDRAKPLTQTGVDEYQSNQAEGAPIHCDRCMVALDTFTRKGQP